MRKQAVSKKDVINEITEVRDLLDDIEKNIDVHGVRSLKLILKAISKFRGKFNHVNPYEERFKREVLDGM